jgi:hypothetical protein
LQIKIPFPMKTKPVILGFVLLLSYSSIFSLNPHSNPSTHQLVSSPVHQLISSSAHQLISSSTRQLSSYDRQWKKVDS